MADKTALIQLQEIKEEAEKLLETTNKGSSLVYHLRKLIGNCDYSIRAYEYWKEKLDQWKREVKSNLVELEEELEMKEILEDYSYSLQYAKTYKGVVNG